MAILFSFALASGSTFGYYRDCKRCSEKVLFQGIPNENPIIKLQEVMKSMHWSIQNENGKKMVFRSSVLRTILTEHIIVNINENSLELSGPKQPIKKAIERLRE